MLLIAVALFAAVQSASADQTLTRSKNVYLLDGDSLVVQSDHNSLQQVFIEGNFSATNITKPAHYPGDHFELQASNPGTYQLRLFFDYASDYKVYVVAKSVEAELGNTTAYYLSAGPFELDVNATFTAPTEPTATIPTTVSPWDSFVGWIGKFGEAFPLWVKVLYLVLGLQFFGVGGLWIRRETRRKESSAQRLDIGDKAYLWLDITYKFLVAAFLAIVAIMFGELLILFILQFMFLVSLQLLSLWDLFVIGFAAGAIIIAYLSRFILERAFDLKPMEDE